MLFKKDWSKREYSIVWPDYKKSIYLALDVYDAARQCKEALIKINYWGKYVPDTVIVKCVNTKEVFKLYWVDIDNIIIDTTSSKNKNSISEPIENHLEKMEESIAAHFEKYLKSRPNPTSVPSSGSKVYL